MKFYFFLVCLFASISMNAQDKVMTVDNQTPGWLSSKMTYAQQVAVEDLTITGYINPTDMKFVNGLINNRKLKVLNINQVHLVSDSGDDVLWKNFITCRKPLQKMIMPSNLVYGGSPSVDANNIDTLIIDSDVLASYYLKSHSYSDESNLPVHLILTEHVTRIPALAFFYMNENGKQCIVTLPSSITEMGPAAFRDSGKLKFSGEYFSLPGNIVRLGSPKNDSYSWYYKGMLIDMPISPSRFDFPESLKAYHGGSKSNFTGISYYYSKYPDHSYASDTIVVGSKCDTLGVCLEAKVAYFKAVVPPQYIYGEYFPYKIEKLYVPKGCLDVYEKKYGGHNEITEIEEIKTIENISLRYVSPHQMLKGETCELFDEIQPSDAFDRRIKWSSSNEEVATVDANGVVTAHKNGTAIITVSTYDGSVTNSCEIIVAQPVTGVSVEPAEIEFHNLGDRAQLKVVFEPEDATNKNVTWKSSNESVCSISADGSIIATGYGKTVVLATTEDGNFVGTCIVVVNEVSAIKQTSLSESGFKVIDRTIVFDDSNDVESQITTLGGALVYKGNAKRICLKTGMYLVKSGTKVQKVCIP